MHAICNVRIGVGGRMRWGCGILLHAINIRIRADTSAAMAAGIKRYIMRVASPTAAAAATSQHSHESSPAQMRHATIPASSRSERTHGPGVRHRKSSAVPDEERVCNEMRLILASHPQNTPSLPQNGESQNPNQPSKPERTGLPTRPSKIIVCIDIK